MFYDNFVALCASVNKTPAYVGRELGIDKSTISCWKARKTKPSDVNAQKIADYFGVTVEELMGKGIKKDPIPKDEAEDSETAELRDIWGSADENERRDLLEMARMLKSRRKQNG
nr:MAG TPA: helix-turn-helix domain protein [Caudoviricetes sp.]